MSSKLLLTTKLDQRLVMSQQLRQAITLLQYNTLDLKQLVQQYIENNPLIEVEEVDHDDVSAAENMYSASFNKSKQYHEDESTLDNYAKSKTLCEHLLEQTLLCQFNEDEQAIAEAIIDSVDEEGRLATSLEDIQKVLSTHYFYPLEMLNKVLARIQTFDPVGVATKDLRECLLIQLNFQTEKDHIWRIAYEIVSCHFELIATCNVKMIIKKLGISQDEYLDAMSLIRSLNPHPGSDFFKGNDINPEPELYVRKIKNSWRVFLAESVLTRIRVNNQYRDIIRNDKQKSSEALNQALQEAQWLMKGLNRRNETLINVASYIIELQKEFLDQGQAYMKPLNIIDVSYALNLHESTVSRVTTGKYIATPRGIYELKYFFPSQVKTQMGEGCSAIAVKSYMKEMIDNEEDVLSDEDITNRLKEKGIHIARRTVAKYREAMRILPSYQRAQKKVQLV